MSYTNYDYLSYAVSDGLTANPGGGKANATPLTKAASPNTPRASPSQGGIVVVTTVATAADSVVLPDPSQLVFPVGGMIQVVNAGANAMQVFGPNNDTINGAATATGVSQPAGSSAFYSLVRYNGATSIGNWYRNLSA